VKVVVFVVVEVEKVVKVVVEVSKVGKGGNPPPPPPPSLQDITIYIKNTKNKPDTKINNFLYSLIIATTPPI
jgi:hypothetical protein